MWIKMRYPIQFQHLKWIMLLLAEEKNFALGGIASDFF